MKEASCAWPKTACCVFLLLAGAMSAAWGAADVFVERFDKPPDKRWTCIEGRETQGLHWSTDGQPPGLHFVARTTAAYMGGPDIAWAPWPVATNPFELSWNVTIEQGFSQTWFYPGIAVALCSGQPGKMTEQDISLVIAVHYAGIAASVRQGELFDLLKEPARGAGSNMADRQLSDTAGGAGGAIESMAWPDRSLDGTQLSLQIQRDAQNVVTFTVYHHGLPTGERTPWCQKQWQMPPAIARIPLNYIVVKRIPVLSVHQGYPEFVMRGWVSNIQGRLLTAAPPPRVSGYVPAAPVLAGGVEVRLQGSSFVPGATVRVGGKPAANAVVASASEVRLTLPPLPPDRRQSLEIVNPDGQTADLSGGLPYGRILERVEPQEALPTGGDVVALVGAGFEEDTQVLFAGRPAARVKWIGPSHLEVRVPAGSAGPAVVSASSGKAAFAGAPVFGYAPHPCLQFNSEQLGELRQKFGLPMFTSYRAVIEKNGASGLELPAPFVGEFYNGGSAAIDELLWAYLFTGEVKYKDKLLVILAQAAGQRSFADFNLMTVTSVATAYDALFPELTPDQRVMLEAYLNCALDAYLKFARGRDWFVTGGAPNRSNTIGVSNCGGGLVALALLHSRPDAGEALDLAVRNSRVYIESCIAADGGCVEGTLYWDYGLTYYLIFAHALRNATGDDRGLLTHPHLKNNAHFPEVVLGGDGQFFTFNDTQPWLTATAICADLDSRDPNPLLRWLADRMARDLTAGEGDINERPQFFPYAFLWRSPLPAPDTFPGVPLATMLKDMQWGVMRSDAAFTPGLVVGVKGSAGILTHHKQADLGSFVLQAGGEALLIDPGYYQPDATAHSLPLIDGEGPGTSGSLLTACRAEGMLREIVVDSTAGYAQPPRRMRRTLVMLKDHVIVLDDIVPGTGRPGQIASLFQTGQKTEIGDGNKTAVIDGKGIRLVLQWFGPAAQLKVSGPLDFGRSWGFKKLADAGKVEWHTLKVEYQAQPDNPLVTVLSPVAPAAPVPAVAVNRRDGLITVTVAGEPALQFRQTPEQGWQRSAVP